MDNMIEIRWHGRGGQGAKTASLLLADAAFNTGKYIQGFPEYGPERMGAPITAYNRISSTPIRIHSNIYEPDYVVVVDDTLLESVPVTEGLKSSGAIIINTTKTADELKPLLNGYLGQIYTIDARKISEETLGKYFPNTPMLASIVKVSGIMTKEEFLEDMKDSFKHKFAKKPEVIEGNMKALEQAWQQVQAGGRKSEVGSQKSEVRGRRSELGKLSLNKNISNNSLSIKLYWLYAIKILKVAYRRLEIRNKK